MTDQDQQKLAESGKKEKPGTFKKGYDPRRWMAGRPRIPKDKKLAEQLIEHVIWDILSEEIEHPVTHEKIDRLRAMIRSMTTSKQDGSKQYLIDRIAGKQTDRVDVTSGGEKLPPAIVNVYIPDNNRNDSKS